jgi:hypothetical protein
MFVDINDTDGICVGDILYLKECPRTRSDYWWYAVRVEKIDDFTRVTVTVPDPSVIQKIHYDDWNKSPDFEDDGTTHSESYMDVNRLAMLVDDVDLSSELGEFLDLL